MERRGGYTHLSQYKQDKLKPKGLDDDLPGIELGEFKDSHGR